MSEKTPRPQSPAVTYFLILYNSVSAILWSAVLGRVVLIAAIHSYGRVFLGVSEYAKWTQTLAILEVVFSLTGTLIYQRARTDGKYIRHSGRIRDCGV